MHVPIAGGDWRIEKDSLGEVRVPASHLWGAQTERSHENFQIGVERYRWGRPVIRAFGIVKKSAALANLEQFYFMPKHVWSKYTGNDGKDMKSFNPEQHLPVVSGLCSREPL